MSESHITHSWHEDVSSCEPFKPCTRCSIGWKEKYCLAIWKTMPVSSNHVRSACYNNKNNSNNIIDNNKQMVNRINQYQYKYYCYQRGSCENQNVKQCKMYYNNSLSTKCQFHFGKFDWRKFVSCDKLWFVLEKYVLKGVHTVPSKQSKTNRQTFLCK